MPLGMHAPGEDLGALGQAPACAPAAAAVPLPTHCSPASLAAMLCCGQPRLQPGPLGPLPDAVVPPGAAWGAHAATRPTPMWVCCTHARRSGGSHRGAVAAAMSPTWLPLGQSPCCRRPGGPGRCECAEAQFLLSGRCMQGANCWRRRRAGAAAAALAAPRSAPIAWNRQHWADLEARDAAGRFQFCVPGSLSGRGVLDARRPT